MPEILVSLMLAVPAAAASAAAPAVDVDLLLCQASREQQLVEHRWREFEHIKEDLTQKLDGGKVASSSRITRYIHRSRPHGIAANQTVAVDGRPVTGEMASRQEAKWQGRIAELRDQRRLHEEALGKWVAERDAKASAMAAMTEAFHLRLEGQDWVDGEPAWAISFFPRGTYQPRSQEQAIFQKMAGVAWVGMRRAVFLRVEADFLDSASIKFGPFAVIRKGSHFLLEQSEVEPGVPMPRTLDLDLSLRIFFVVSRNERRATFYRDFRRVNPPWPAFVP